MSKYETLEKLNETIRSRRGANPKESYVAKMFNKGRCKMAQKVGEEAVETVIEAAKNDKDGVISESADLLFHLLVLWQEMGIDIEEVLQTLQNREGMSGIEEKNNR